jgi:hypothetical protein
MRCLSFLKPEWQAYRATDTFQVSIIAYLPPSSTATRSIENYSANTRESIHFGHSGFGDWFGKPRENYSHFAMGVSGIAIIANRMP